jgi:hypothetical protein
MKKPKKCCLIGSYEHTVPMPIKGRRVDVDFCTSDIIAALNAANITTAASCCGHGKMAGNIMLDDNRILWVENHKRGVDVVPPVFPCTDNSVTILEVQITPKNKRKIFRVINHPEKSLIGGAMVRCTVGGADNFAVGTRIILITPPLAGK